MPDPELHPRGTSELAGRLFLICHHHSAIAEWFSYHAILNLADTRILRERRSSATGQPMHNRLISSMLSFGRPSLACGSLNETSLLNWRARN
jgi:hypothetical protein